MLNKFFLFYRNASQVPVLVRLTDIFWSMAVASNIFQSSPIKFPCSAYSVSMPLVLTTNGWDAGPEAIGEDLHMFLKCFFETKGRVIVKTIFSPASQCNVAASGTGGIKNYLLGIHARQVQALRHLWGGLDFGYVMRKTLYAVFEESDEEAPIENTWSFSRLIILLHRIIEAHMVMAHLAIFSTIGGVARKYYTSHGYEFSEALNYGYWLCDIYSLFVVPNLFISLFIYQKYHQWCGVDRWAIQERILAKDRGFETAIVGDRKIQRKKSYLVDPLTNEHIHHLGIRSQICSIRKPWHIIDIVLMPFASFLYYVFPCIQAQLQHLITNKLDYKVAGKPQLKMVDIKIEDDTSSTAINEKESEVDEDDKLGLVSSSSNGSAVLWEHKVCVD